ncbi:MAG: hypothetical protein ACI865_000985 [Flavobacteriaceae bacterium]|jgi:hypothetical protein
MKFLYPEFLWAFTVLLIPIVIHLFNFKRYKTHYFSSLQFVKHVDQQTRSTQKLKHILILLARLLAFILLVFAFAQPYFSNPDGGDLQKETVLAIYLDNSFSMQARGIEGELLSEARESAEAIVKEAPQGTQFIIGTNEMSGIEQRKISKIDALEKLDKITYSPLTRTLDEIIDWQERTVNSEDINAARSLVQSIILSDFQRHKVSKASKLNLTHFEFHAVQLVPEQKENIYIDSAWFSTPIRKIGQKNEINIRIVNTSKEALQNIEVTVAVDRYKKSFYVDLPANGKKSTSLTYTDKTKGFKTGKITVADDHVLFDDTYFISYEVKDHANVLVLNGEDAIDNVGIVLDLEDFYVVEENEITAITLDNFKDKDMVILNGVNKLSSGVENYLLDFYDNGGSLSLFPGKNPIVSSWNRLLAKVKLPLLGSRISSGTRIKSLNYDDDFIKDIIQDRSDRLNLPSVNTSFRPIVSNATNYNTLITMQNGLPLLAYSTGKGNVYMFYSAIHPDWGNFSKDALFSTCVLRMSELSQRSQPIAMTIGNQSVFPIYKSFDQEEVIHLQKDQLDIIPQNTERSGVSYISLNQLDKFDQLLAGNYDIKTSESIGNLSLNYSRGESQLNYFGEEEVLEIFSNRGALNASFATMDGMNSPVSQIAIEKPFDYWKLCIVLTLIFVLAEMLLVRFLKS